MKFSTFSRYGFMAFTSRKSPHELVYRSMKSALGGDTSPAQTYDLTPGTYAEARVYGQAQAIARGNNDLIRAGNQSNPRKVFEMLPTVLLDFRITPPPNATIQQKRDLLTARASRDDGATQSAVENQLLALLGPSRFVAYRPLKTAESNLWPTVPGNGPGVYTRIDIAPKQFSLILGNTVVGSPDWVSYAPLNADVLPPPTVLVGDQLCVNAGDLANAERVTCIATRTLLGVPQFQATFTLFHGFGFVATTGPFPAQFSTKRFSFIVVDTATAVNPVLRAQIDELMGRVARDVSEWAIVSQTSPGVIGPFTIASSPLGTISFGAITI